MSLTGYITAGRDQEPAPPVASVPEPVDFGFDGLDDWSLGQRITTARLRREAPRFFKSQSMFETLTVLQSHWNDHMSHLIAAKALVGKQALIPILTGPPASPKAIFSGDTIR